jgi:beta-lactamase superfamily II metal-dependent hydrolase
MDLEIFNVEHGACALLTSDAGTRLMIDCGHNATTGWMPGNHLRSFGVTRLDMLCITNYDEDHVSGFRDLDSRVHIDWLLRNKSVTGADLYRLKSECGIGDNVAHLANRVGTFLTSQNPEPSFPAVTREVYYNRYPDFDDENNLSLVLCLIINGIRFIFPGDLESPGWLALLRKEPALRASLFTTDVLIASHHGRESGICTEIFDDLRCNPYIVVISDDYHQYDTQKTTTYYASKCKGITFRGEQRKVLTTRNDGKITFRFTGLQWWIL